MSVILEASNIYKSFPGVQALENVSVTINKGEVHAIVGENGAGKSTLMKVFGGVYIPDRGDILINGKHVNLKSVQVSNKEGISVIFQEFNLMNELTVAENIFISKLPTIKILNFLNMADTNKRASKLLMELGINIKPTEYIKNLSVSQKQLVEIAKSLAINADIIIMDEPTASLNIQEVEKLFEIIRSLKSKNKTIIYVSHRLKEVFDIADRVTVLRDGKYVGTNEVNKINQGIVVKMMIGRDMSAYYKLSKAKLGNNILEVKSLTKKDIYTNISFTLREGEVLGFAGLMGCGREELLKSIYGLNNFNSGEIILNNKKLSIKNPIEAMEKGIAFVSEDRKESGIFLEMNVRENATINILKKLSILNGTFINLNKEKKIFDDYVNYINIKYSGDKQLAMNLSGGNQQKVVLARALMTECKVLILLEPTRGIDVGAKMEVYSLISDLAEKGIGILLVSSELIELLSISNRILVMWQGKMTALSSINELSEEEVMLCATGHKNLLEQDINL
jgi:ABC-type sugar transport system ATPase subunit